MKEPLFCAPFIAFGKSVAVSEVIGNFRWKLSYERGLSNGEILFEDFF